MATEITLTTLVRTNISKISTSLTSRWSALQQNISAGFSNASQETAEESEDVRRADARWSDGITSRIQPAFLGVVGVVECCGESFLLSTATLSTLEYQSITNHLRTVTYPSVAPASEYVLPLLPLLHRLHPAL